jgi:hypothetical protein
MIKDITVTDLGDTLITNNSKGFNATCSEFGFAKAGESAEDAKNKFFITNAGEDVRLAPIPEQPREGPGMGEKLKEAIVNKF